MLAAWGIQAYVIKLANGTMSAESIFGWMALSAVPSSLLLSVTSYVSTDLAALPLLWVLPLALYLLTFIVAFASRQLFPARRMVWLQAMLLVPLCAEMFVSTPAMSRSMAASATPPELKVLFP